jgi:hypothetical protein
MVGMNNGKKKNGWDGNPVQNSKVEKIEQSYVKFMLDSDIKKNTIQRSERK